MRKITKDVVGAFNWKEKARSSNTKSTGTELYLHDNMIARWRDDQLQITNAGWSSNTTKERLNGIKGVNIYQKNFEWFLNNKAWNGSWTVILSGGDWEYIADHTKDDEMDRLKTIGIIAMMGDIFHKGDRKAGNDWKARMLKAGLEGRGLIMPSDWETLSEEEKQSRLDGAINELI